MNRPKSLVVASAVPTTVAAAATIRPAVTTFLRTVDNPKFTSPPDGDSRGRLSRDLGAILERIDKAQKVS
jgi:hypothetical protein